VGAAEAADEAAGQAADAAGATEAACEAADSVDAAKAGGCRQGCRLCECPLKKSTALENKLAAEFNTP
jgi:hypothetical protein